MPQRFNGRDVFRRSVLAFGLSIDDAHIATKAGGMTIPRFFVKGWLVKRDHRLFREDSELAENAAIALIRGLLLSEDRPATLDSETAAARDLIGAVAEIVEYDEKSLHALAILGSKQLMGALDPKDLEDRDFLDALLEGLISHLKHNRDLPEV